MAANLSASFKSSILIIIFLYTNVSSSGVNMVTIFALSSMIFVSCRVIHRQLFIRLASNSFRCFSSSASFVVRAAFHFGCSIVSSSLLDFMCWSWFVIRCASLSSLRLLACVVSLQFRLMYSRFLFRTLYCMLANSSHVTIFRV